MISESEKFLWELGYCITQDNYTRRGYSSGIVRGLLDRVEKINIIASTELDDKNPMKRILEREGFVQKGRSWKSDIHGNELGLFFKISVI